MPDGSRAFIRNYLHWHGEYLAGFADAGLSVRQCLDLPFTEFEVELVNKRNDAIGRISPYSRMTFPEALIGLPAVLVWDLQKD